ncbi:3-isopropylmalate dehydratase [Thermotoga maritima MSB8]|jgi:3-isopropylmalate/(R)-2-methylmalate dehydratase large subunit|uniref:3-isopropylmalate dehydratase large subunit 2 n=1 Tax=Thermotoga maritima (strain ATCC 43589 / DSM 3109 / JCM 10099 / NBRC 100826 / MSB8) TaxID=243274 RepID=LEUC2_THEMA|nr:MULTISPECIES: 3-isopropylmalate dehydratase large subunit [Thermotoga]Q9WZ24.1 RecName: Full=3-isopropylmalate dehydratase large subunit 2; AltName: Full=Alpha-IPM isomerase 2; Short=IPMI 2; AltName: Full=Isopropylmalate isomerase 2 [Thermotoga maritima MSB8]AAD35639.1 3-isopropylmalate dehydratase, large subunit [Thermotoga maritima MSB8]ACB08739.1 3-isopropylmalate dehydratase, large subunit [Thermotoga sp. RQ2]AGL49476.1 3-isopropylmalate dehydratase large subunit [Thermotoga maritima MSB
MTLAEKILSQKAGRKVEPGEFLLLEPDIALANDITAPLAIKKFKEYGGKKVKYPDRVVLVPDHFTPNKDIKSAMQVKMMREFAREQGIEKFFEIGRMGIEHVLLPEEGIVKSGDLVVGADSHTCTYGALGAFATGVGSTDIAGFYLIGKVWFRVPESIKVTLRGKFKDLVTAKDLVLKLISILGVDGANYKAIEFSGPGVKEISMDGRFTISNMAIEAGGKTGLFPVDEITIAYERERGIEVEEMYPDEDAKYVREVEMDLSELEPQVAYPFLPSNAKDVSEAEKERIKIDQAVIGSCTNGRIEDLRLAAQILKGRTVSPDVRCIIIPGSQKVYKQALKEGLIDIFIDAGCAVSTPTCGPCLGGHMGVLAEGEVAISTTNRNFVGRMGHPNSKVFLASPAVAAASAIKGYIADPRKL